VTPAVGSEAALFSIWSNPASVFPSNSEMRGILTPAAVGAAAIFSGWMGWESAKARNALDSARFQMLL